jgi:hypothetical protein
MAVPGFSHGDIFAPILGEKPLWTGFGEPGVTEDGGPC